tara:strand:+ start:9920 stop:11059 length:1140 start_codon:yes stop_codon:yes gene_type:complete
MKNFLLIFLFLFPLNAQTQYFGYFESEADRINFNNKAYSFGYHKVRVDFEHPREDGITISGNVNWQTYHGQTTWNFLDFLPVKTLEPIYSDGKYEMTITDTFYLDNFYARKSFRFFDIIIGRQPISMGVGYAWNPLDMFNQKDLMDPAYEQPGVDAARLEIPMGDRTGLDIIIAKNDSIDGTEKMLQFKTGIGSFGVTLNYANRYHLVPYWRIMDITFTHNESNFVGGSVVGQIGEYGIWTEVFKSLDETVEVGEYVLGADHTFDNGVYVMGEYFHNFLGAKKGKLDLNNYLYAFSGETKSLMQNYIFLMSSYGFTDFISGSVIVFGNLDDSSFSFLPMVNWSIEENVTLSVMYKKTSATSGMIGIQNSAWRLRIRAHF